MSVCELLRGLMGDLGENDRGERRGGGGGSAGRRVLGENGSFIGDTNAVKSSVRKQFSERIWEGQ